MYINVWAICVSHAGNQYIVIQYEINTFLLNGYTKTTVLI